MPRPEKPQKHRSQRPAAREHSERVQIYGMHPAEAALKNPVREIRGIQATANAAQRLGEIIQTRGIIPEIVQPRDLDRLLGGEAVHQGIVLDAEPLPDLAVDDIAEASLVVALDQITDPHNVGAILRSCAAFGVGGVIMTAHHSPPLSGVLAKAASGALDMLRIVLVPNLARAMAQLGELDFERIGLDSGEARYLDDHVFGAKTALVLGAEDKGLRRLTREHCELLLALRTADGLRSLNVSNAAAIALHTAFAAQTARR